MIFSRQVQEHHVTIMLGNVPTCAQSRMVNQSAVVAVMKRYWWMDTDV